MSVLTRSGFIKTFKRQLKKLRNRKFQRLDILNAMVKLYRDKPDAIEKLKHVRLNPDFTCKERNDASCLEFFVP